MMCFVEVYKLHNCSNIDKVVEDLTDRIKVDLTNLADKISTNVSKKEQLSEAKVTLADQMKSMEEAIIKKSEDIKILIEEHTAQLLLEVKSIEKEKLKVLESAMQELEQEMLILESFIRYCGELKEKGTSFEISRVANDLHKRAKELQSSSVDLENYESIGAIFTSTDLQDLLLTGNRNFIGKNSVQTSLGLMHSFNYNLTVISCSYVTN